MGTVYSVACKECKVVRDLDKFYSAKKIETREDALKYMHEIYGNKATAFRAGLLVSFLAEHEGHECVFFNEHSFCQEGFDPDYDNEYMQDTDYWKDA